LGPEKSNVIERKTFIKELYTVERYYIRDWFHGTLSGPKILNAVERKTLEGGRRGFTVKPASKTPLHIVRQAKKGLKCTSEEHVKQVCIFYEERTTTITQTNIYKKCLSIETNVYTIHKNYLCRRENENFKTLQNTLE